MPTADLGWVERSGSRKACLLPLGARSQAIGARHTIGGDAGVERDVYALAVFEPIADMARDIGCKYAALVGVRWARITLGASPVLRVAPLVSPERDPVPDTSEL